LIAPIEEQAKEYGRDRLGQVVAELEERGPAGFSDMPPAQLVDGLAAEHPHLEVYFINGSNVVYAASDTADVGLDLGALGQETRDVLVLARRSGRVVQGRLSVANMSGRLVQFSYSSPPGVDWIVEVGVDLRSFATDRYGADYTDFLFEDYWQQLAGQNLGLARLDVISVTKLAAWSFITGATREEVVRNDVMAQARSGANGVYTLRPSGIWSGEPRQVYTVIQVPEFDYHFAQDLLVETVFDMRELVRGLTTTAVLAVGVAFLFSAALLVALNLMLKKNLFSPFEDLLAQFQLAAAGDYDQVSQATADRYGTKDFTRIFQALHTMIEAVRVREEALRDADGEKRILLQEIHHRVKNNLQIMASLLNLERNRVDVRPADEALQAAESRVKAMAAVHTLLYQSDRLGYVRVEDFVVQHGSHLFDLYSSAYVKLEPSFYLEPLVIPMDEAVPLALILTEVITNAVKHGIAPDGTVHVEISLTMDEHGGYSLAVRDHGNGFGESAAARVGALGFQLVRQLAQQIHGQVDLDNAPDGGAVVTIRVPGHS
jgi:two-component sensor histidine kinase